MTQKLKVPFDNPEHGWVGLSINYGDNAMSIIASYRYLNAEWVCYTPDSRQFRCSAEDARCVPGTVLSICNKVRERKGISRLSRRRGRAASEAR